MAVTAVINATASSQSNTTKNGSCAPVNNQSVLVAMCIANTGAAALTISDVALQYVRKEYGPIADEIRSSLVGQVIPATGALFVTWAEIYSSSGTIQNYGIDIKLAVTDGVTTTVVTPAPAPGTVTLACASVLAGDSVWVNGVQFTGSATTSFINGVGAPSFYIGASDTACGANLAAAINQIFGAGTATASTGTVTCVAPVIQASNPATTITVGGGTSTITAASNVVGDSITITGRATVARGGGLLTITFTSTSTSSQTGGTGAPFFYAGANATAYAANLRDAIIALFGTSTATASSGVVTTGATLAANDFGVGPNAAATAPNLTVKAGTNVATVQPNVYTLFPGTVVTALPTP